MASTSTGSKIKSMKKAKAQVQNLATRMKNYSSYIDEINNQLNIMMRGDGTDSYWQGASANAWYTKAIGNKGLSGLITFYSNCFREFKQFAAKIEKADLKTSLKGAKKAAIKAQLAKCTGSTYTTGVASSKDDKKINAVPATVSDDVANDNQTKESYKAYLSLKNALQRLIDNTDGMSKIWTNIAANTEGKMSSDAKTRANAAITRKKQARNLLDILEEEYIGDILFS